MARYAVHEAGVARCRELIAARQYVLDSEWDDVQPSADDLLQELDRRAGIT